MAHKASIYRPGASSCIELSAKYNVRLHDGDATQIHVCAVFVYLDTCLHPKKWTKLIRRSLYTTCRKISTAICFMDVKRYGHIWVNVSNLYCRYTGRKALLQCIVSLAGRQMSFPLHSISRFGRAIDGDMERQNIVVKEQ